MGLCKQGPLARRRYSITASAWVRRASGTVRPRVRAVFRLIANSNVVGCSIGRSAAWLPLGTARPRYVTAIKPRLARWLALCEATMRKISTILLNAEEQLFYGSELFEMRQARNKLRAAVPGCLLLELLEAKIDRTKAADWPNVSLWSA